MGRTREGNFLPAHAPSRVEVYEVPGIHALNCLIHDSMSGGINSSPHLDCGAKGMAQQLLELPVAVPQQIRDELTGDGVRPHPGDDHG